MGAQAPVINTQQFTPPAAPNPPAPAQQNAAGSPAGIPQFPTPTAYVPAPEYVPSAFEGNTNLYDPQFQAQPGAQNPQSLPAAQPNAQSSLEQQLAALTQQVSLLGQQPQLQQTQNQNPEMQQLLQLLKDQYTKTTDPGYFEMDYSKFMDTINGNAEAGQPSQLQNVLKYVYEKAKSDALAAVEERLSPVSNRVEATQSALGRILAAAEVQRLEKSFKDRDPYFEDNIRKAGAYLSTPEGMRWAEDPKISSNAIERAYRMQVADRLTDPLFQQQLATQALQQQQAQLSQSDLYKMQGGFAPGAQYAQAPQQPTQNGQPRVETDQDVVARIMNFKHMF